jgi:hypothetical protein
MKRHINKGVFDRTSQRSNPSDWSIFLLVGPINFSGESRKKAAIFLPLLRLVSNNDASSPRRYIFAQALMQNPTTPCGPTAAHRCANRKINGFPNHPCEFSGRL